MLDLACHWLGFYFAQNLYMLCVGVLVVVSATSGIEVLGGQVA